MALVLLTAPEKEPIPLNVAKQHIRVDFDADDLLIEQYTAAARRYLEIDYMRRVLITQQWELTLDHFPHGDTITIPLPPLQGVDEFSYVDHAGTPHIVPPDTYAVDTKSERGRLVMLAGCFPSVCLYPVNAVSLKFTAGYGSNPEDVPQHIRSAILLLIGDLYESREDTAIAQGVSITQIPNGIASLLSSERIASY